jgi:hypothetical protein
LHSRIQKVLTFFVASKYLEFVAAGRWKPTPNANLM